MRNISDSKISYYARNKRTFLSNPRYKSSGRVKTAKQKKDFKFNFVKPRKDWSIYGGWVNTYEPVNKGRLGSTQQWKIEKLGRKYY
jgi:hypothetical protein